MEQNKSLNFLTVAIALIISALIIAFGFKNIIRTERTVSVRGLSEREVDADLAVWPLSFQLGANDLQILRSEIVKKTGITVDYLKSHNLSDSDITVRAPSITDTSLDPYMDSNKQKYIYIAKVEILVRSQNVKAVKKAQSSSLDLAESGIAVSQDYGSRVQYDFTGLNEIKPEMIAEATSKAHEAAEQFASDSGSKVGKIKTASQGVFTITDAAQGLEEKKNIRVNDRDLFT